MTNAASSVSPARHLRAKVFIVDDHAVVRRGLRALLDEEPDLAVCGEAGSVEEALALIPGAKPDVVIVDLSLPGRSGFELLKVLRDLYPHVRALAFSMHQEAVEAERALLAGARGYVMKEEPPSVLRDAIRRVLDGKIHVSPRMAERLIERSTYRRGSLLASPLERLSIREREVFEMIGRGFSTRQIAASMNLSIKTIETYRAQLKEKLNVRTSTELLQMAVSWTQRL